MADTISVLSELRSNYNCFDEAEEPYYRALSEAIEAVKAERKGHWIDIPCGTASLWKCSECGEIFSEDFYYCPYCGSKNGRKSGNA